MQEGGQLRVGTGEMQRWSNRSAAALACRRAAPALPLTSTSPLPTPHAGQLPDGSKVKSVHIAARIKAPPSGTGLAASLTMRPV